MIIALLGAITSFVSYKYGLGTLARIGAGFFPTVLGTVLLLLGCAIYLTADIPEDTTDSAFHGGDASAPVDWRGWFAIVGGVLLFIVLTPVLGLIPGTFLCVFVSAMGDRSMTALSSAVLAAVVSILGAIMFVWGLQVGLPYFGS